MTARKLIIAICILLMLVALGPGLLSYFKWHNAIENKCSAENRSKAVTQAEKDQCVPINKG